jgi:hypothetical protein
VPKHQVVNADKDSGSKGLHILMEMSLPGRNSLHLITWKKHSPYVLDKRLNGLVDVGMLQRKLGAPAGNQTPEELLVSQFIN